MSEYLFSYGTLQKRLATFTGNDNDYIEGTLLEITQEELLHADTYEPPDYKRISVTMASGKEGWIYVAA